MESRYIVLTIGGRMSGDYSKRVCNVLRNSRQLKEGIVGDFEKEPGNCARFGTKNYTVVDIYLQHTNPDNLTFIGISLEIEESLDHSEEIIIGIRKELSSLLLAEGLMIH